MFVSHLKCQWFLWSWLPVAEPQFSQATLTLNNYRLNDRQVVPERQTTNHTSYMTCMPNSSNYLVFSSFHFTIIYQLPFLIYWFLSHRGAKQVQTWSFCSNKTTSESAENSVIAYLMIKSDVLATSSRGWNATSIGIFVLLGRTKATVFLCGRRPSELSATLRIAARETLLPTGLEFWLLSARLRRENISVSSRSR